MLGGDGDAEGGESSLKVSQTTLQGGVKIGL